MHKSYITLCEAYIKQMLAIVDIFPLEDQNPLDRSAYMDILEQCFPTLFWFAAPLLYFVMKIFRGADS
jgi:hypothetical protein